MTINVPEGSLLIDGEWVTPQRTSDIRSPWDGNLAGTVGVAGARDMDRALAAADRAFATARALPRWKRADICRRIADLLRAQREQFAQVILRESGKPVQFARAEVSRAITTFQLAAEEATRVGGEVIPLDIASESEGAAGLALRFPLGVVAGITPFNFPLNLAAHKMAPALAAGCSIVLKPAPQAPLTALALGEIARQAGVPAGVVNVVPAESSTAQRLATDERPALLSFTGSAKVGWHLKALAGRKRVVLELGGNAAAVVHSDADVEWAVRRTVASAFACAGQVCIKTQRLFVQRSLYDGFRSRFLEQASRLHVGDPEYPDTVVGPLINEAAADRVMEWIDEAKAGGARVVLGGTREGNVVQPTVIEGAGPQMRVWSEEVFAPVVTLEPYDRFDEALERVNASRYGLQAGVFTHDLRLATEAVRGLQVGGVILNDVPSYRVDNYPYGGVKDSGFGREGVRHSVDEMTEVRMVVLNLHG